MVGPGLPGESAVQRWGEGRAEPLFEALRACGKVRTGAGPRRRCACGNAEHRRPWGEARIGGGAARCGAEHGAWGGARGSGRRGLRKRGGAVPAPAPCGAGAAPSCSPRRDRHGAERAVSSVVAGPLAGPQQTHGGRVQGAGRGAGGSRRPGASCRRGSRPGLACRGWGEGQVITSDPSWGGGDRAPRFWDPGAPVPTWSKCLRLPRVYAGSTRPW